MKTQLRRVVVNFADTPHYQIGQERLRVATLNHCSGAEFHCWSRIQSGWPTHQQKPYAFKAYAMRDLLHRGAEVILWADACILPIRDMEPLWQRIERDGYWISNNGWNNAQWTADSAYPDLFDWPVGGEPQPSLDDRRQINRKIPHVVATTFGVNVKHPVGKAILDEYIRLATETNSFCGPWKNTPETPCGPPECLGHRHDQSALSVIAWRNQCALTNAPEIFAYRGGETDQTILIADGAY